MKPNSFIQNTTALLAIQIANQLLPLVTIPYLTRALGIDAYGVYAFSLAMVTFACVITDFGFNLWATANVASNRNDKEYLQRLFGSITGAKLLLIILCVPLIWIYTANSEIPIDNRSALYLSALPIIGLTLQPVWLFNGLERMAYITAFILISRLAFIILTFTLVASSEDLALLMGINGISQIIAAILGFGILIRLGYTPTFPTLSSCCYVLRKSAPFFYSRLAVSTYTAGGALFLGIVSGTRSVAIYAVAEQLYRGAQALLSPLGQVMYPYMVRTRNFKVLVQSTVAATLLACLGSALSAYLGVHIIQFLFGTSYVEALPVLQIFLITIIINTPSILLGYPMLGALGRLKLANYSVMFAGLLQVIVLCICYAFGRTTPVDVAIAVLLAELAVLMLRAFWSAREWRRQSSAHI